MRLHVHAFGDAASPPVVCLHGVTGHGRRFRRLAEERLGARYRVLAFDLRGHGRSGWEPPWSLEAHAADVLETMDDLGVERTILIGHSFGGRIAAVIAATHPERVERLVLLDPAIEEDPATALEIAEDSRNDRVADTVEEAIQARLPGLKRGPRSVLEEEMREHLVQGDDGRFRYRYAQSAVVAAWGEMSRPAAPVAQLPTLLVVAEDDPVPTPAQADAYRAALGELGTVLTVPGGHVVLWDAFDETADAIEAFLEAS